MALFIIIFFSIFYLKNRNKPFDFYHNLYYNIIKELQLNSFKYEPTKLTRDFAAVRKNKFMDTTRLSVEIKARAFYDGV